MNLFFFGGGPMMLMRGCRGQLTLIFWRSIQIYIEVTAIIGFLIPTASLDIIGET